MSREERKERHRLPLSTVTIVFTEAGYRCAVPTCRQILALDLHHIWRVSEGGPDEAYNLIALCPTCHALYHRGTMSQDAIYAYKAMLVALSQAFDMDAVDRLLFLEVMPEDFLVLSGDGVVGYGRLVVAGLARVTQKANNAWQLVTYTVNISDKGRALVGAWKRGDRSELRRILDPTSGATNEARADAGGGSRTKQWAQARHSASPSNTPQIAPQPARASETRSPVLVNPPNIHPSVTDVLIGVAGSR